MKILWHSNSPLVGTGYGSQTATFAPRLRDQLGHDVEISAYWGLGGSVINWEGMTVYPGDEQWGNRLLPMLCKQADADVVITLMDVWVLTAKRIEDLPLASWVPVDHDPCPPKVVEFFKRTKATPIAMSRFGERMLKDAGLRPLYVPHGINTNTFRPMPEARADTRDKMHVPRDAFLVGMVAANKGNSPPRKAFPQVLEAFSRLRANHDDAYLYLHTEPSGVGINAGLNLPKLAEACGLPADSVMFTNPLSLEMGMPPEQVASLYSAFDVLANPAYGEGFGIPIVEAQACGTPVIVTDWTAMPELVGDGWAVGGDRYWNGQQGSFWKAPSVSEIHGAMEEAYERRGAGPSAAARKFALNYDAKTVTTKYWKPALAELEASLTKRAARILAAAA